jgi:hypothetical protein
MTDYADPFVPRHYQVPNWGYTPYIAPGNFATTSVSNLLSSPRLYAPIEPIFEVPSSPVSPVSPRSPLSPIFPPSPAYSSSSSDYEEDEDRQFQNRTNIRKAKMSEVESELMKRNLPTDGNADQKRKRLMEHMFPKNGQIKRGKSKMRNYRQISNGFQLILNVFQLFFLSYTTKEQLKYVQDQLK